MSNWKPQFLTDLANGSVIELELVESLPETASCNRDHQAAKTCSHPSGALDSRDKATRVPWRLPISLIACLLFGLLLTALGIHTKYFREEPLQAGQYWLYHEKKYPPTAADIQAKKALSGLISKQDLAIARRDIKPGELITNDNVIIKAYAPGSKEIASTAYPVKIAWQLWGRSSKSFIPAGKILDARSISAEPGDSADHLYFAVSSVSLDPGDIINLHVCMVPVESMTPPKGALTSSYFMDLVAAEHIEPGTIITKTQVVRKPSDRKIR